MFLEHREKEENKRQATAGYDLTDAYAQISYCSAGRTLSKDDQPAGGSGAVSDSGAAGTVYRSRPLGVRTESAGSGSDWRGFLADGLLTKAAHQEMVEVGGQNYSSVALLSLFLKRTMSLLAPIVRPGTPAGARLFCAGSVCTHIVGGDGCGRHARSEKCESVSDRTRGDFFLLQYLPTRRTLETGCASV